VLEGLLTVAAPEEQILPTVSAKYRDLQLIMPGANQGLLYLLLREVH